MPRTDKTPIKAACLACRSSKTRCDGEKPCKPCSNKGRECSYLPSRRGGPRRGARYAESVKRRNNLNNATSLEDQTQQSNLSPEIMEDFDPALDSLINLVAPYSGIHNLDLSPDSLPSPGEALQLWGQLTPVDDRTFTSTPVEEPQPAVVRAYRSDEDILNAYYIYIHPYFPLLPPPLQLQTNDDPSIINVSTDPGDPKETDLPYWPTSPLSLALSAILVLIPPNPDIFPINNPGIVLRRSYAQLFAQAALSAVEREMDVLIPQPTLMFDSGDQFHSKIPQRLNSVLALITLSIYEYCQRGNASRMRARINHAFTSAMDMSLHDLGSGSSKFSEAQSRAWWMIVFMQYLSSSVLCVPPMIFPDDHRITTPFPKFGVKSEPFEYLIKAQIIMWGSGKMIHKIEHVTKTEPFPDYSAEIKDYDTTVVSLIMEVDRALRETYDYQNESPIALNIWKLTRIMAYTTRVRLHRFHAFMDVPLFLDKYCDLSSINVDGFADSTSSSAAWIAHRKATFPFTEQESARICLKASLTVATTYRNLPYPHPCGAGTCDIGSLNRKAMDRNSCCTSKFPRSIPWFVCTAMQSSYAILMLLHQVKACLETGRLVTCYHLMDRPEVTTEAADAERLIEELCHGVEYIGSLFKSDLIFEGVGNMGREVESAYLAAFPDRLHLATL